MLLKIAICEDDPTQSKNVRRMVSTWGGEQRLKALVYTYDNCEDFLEDWTQKPDFDLIVRAYEKEPIRYLFHWIDCSINRCNMPLEENLLAAGNGGRKVSKAFKERKPGEWRNRQRGSAFSFNQTVMME